MLVFDRELGRSFIKGFPCIMVGMIRFTHFVEHFVLLVVNIFIYVSITFLAIEILFEVVSYT